MWVHEKLLLIWIISCNAVTPRLSCIVGNAVARFWKAVLALFYYNTVGLSTDNFYNNWSIQHLQLYYP